MERSLLCSRICRSSLALWHQEDNNTSKINLAILGSCTAFGNTFIFCDETPQVKSTHVSVLKSAIKLATAKAFTATAETLALQADSQDVLNGPHSSSRWADEYFRSARIMYRFLAMPSMLGRPRAPFLRQLLLRLNFNNFMQQDVADFMAQDPSKAL